MSKEFPRQFMTVSAVALLGLALMLPLGGCRNDRVAVVPGDKSAPQYGYHLHELAQLQMMADDILELERQKQYGKIYDDYGSPAFQRGVNRRHFMIMSNCVETHLGGLQEYNRNDIGFRRETIRQGRNNITVDVLNRPILRGSARIEEQMVFVPYGVGFRLNSLYWIAKDKGFLKCIEESAAVEVATRPGSTVKPESTDETATAKKPETEAGTEKPAADATEPSGTEPVASDPETPVSSERKPTEAGAGALPARPAGAGAVKDVRPTKKGDGENSASRIEIDEPADPPAGATSGDSH